MKINDLTENTGPLITPTYKWRTNGDGSFTVRIEYTPDKVYVHTNKKKAVLDHLIASRYGPKRFAY